MINHSLDDAASDVDTSIDIKSEQLRKLFSAVPLNLLAILVNSSIVSVSLIKVIDIQSIVIWFAVTNSLSLYRLFYYLRFIKLDRHQILNRNWYRCAVMTSALSGACWGAAGIFLFAENSVVHQIFLGFVIGGMCAGGVITLSSVLNAARAFVVLAATPIILQFLLVNTEISTAMIIMWLAFLAVILVSAQRLNTSFNETLSITRKHEIAHETIRRQANYDLLTNLPNRRLLLVNLKQEVAKAHRHNRVGAIFSIDLDRFKSINDSLGHRVGDELLLQSARRIQSRLRTEDTIARTGGDEFIILLPEIAPDARHTKKPAMRVANQIRRLFDQAFLIHGHELHITVSIGITLFPKPQVTNEDLIQQADIAMNRAKESGRNAVQLFSQDMQDTLISILITEKGLRQAIESEEFELHYQPQYNSLQQLIGAEALIRWTHPLKGLVGPGEFIATAEQTGLIVPIGNWVLYTACKNLAQLGSKTNLILSVNVSPRQFQTPGFCDQVLKILVQTGADPRRLKLEITEGMVMGNVEQSIEIMQQLKALGISFSIDDFGTGYSSLAYLNRLPVNELKIDQSFVRDITNSENNAIIVSTIIAMAKHLNLEIIAEGVETIAELNFLKAKGCFNFQGYHFAHPAPFEAFLSLIKNSHNDSDPLPIEPPQSRIN